MPRLKFPSYVRLSVFLVAICAATAAVAQTSSSDELVKSTSRDRAAVRRAKRGRHARPANTPRGATLRAQPLLRGRSLASGARDSNSQTRYPGDLVFNGGPVVEFAQSHTIYLRPNGVCPIAVCWGNPEGFLRDLPTAT